MTGPAAALFLAPNGPATELLAALDAAVPSGVIRVGHRIGGELPKPNPDTGEPLPLLPCPFAAVLLARGPPAQTVPALRTVTERIAPSLDLAASALLVGTEHSVKPGDGAVLVTMLVRRREGFTARAFRDRWLGGHAPFGLRPPVSGYRQLHAGPAGLDGVPATDRFDGAGMVLFRDSDHVATVRAAPDVAQDATRDEMQFIDHARSMLAMFRFSD